MTDDEMRARRLQYKVVWGHAPDPEAGFAGSFATREEAIADGIEEYGEDHGGFHICSGRMYASMAKYMPPADSILEQTRLIIEEETGRESDTWGDILEDPEAKLELDKLLADWADKHQKVWWWEHEPEDTVELIEGKEISDETTE